MKSTTVRIGLLERVAIGGKGVLPPMANSDEHHEALVAGGRLLEACCQTAALLEPADAAFHNVALPVQLPVVVNGHRAVAPTRNHRFGPQRDDDAAQVVGIVGPVRQHVAGAQSRQQQLGLRDIAGLSPESGARATAVRRRQPEHAAWCRSRPGCGPRPPH